MTEKALHDFQRARGEQQSRNEARAIRKGVDQAQKNRAASTFRWPFELLQNALDTGPRDGRHVISIRLTRDESAITFAHDGKPFTSRDLAALLSGGSNKEYESETTTGRFGTGFLATHALSDRMRLDGILACDSGYERFDLEIDRHGDEEQILENTDACNASIAAATRLEKTDGIPSANFDYPLEDGAIADEGLETFHNALPYLYATRPTLGLVQIDQEGQREIWTAGDVSTLEFEHGIVSCRTIRVKCETDSREMAVYWFSPDQHAGCAIVVVEGHDGVTTVVLPQPHARQIYRDYPLSGSTFLPSAFVLNGDFDPDGERVGFSRSEPNDKVLSEAFQGALLGVRFAFQQGWKGAHLLAAVRKPDRAFSPDESDLSWWVEHLSAFARRLSELPIVECRIDSLPAISQSEAVADFVFPRLRKSDGEDAASHDRLWKLMDLTDELYPPVAELSEAWTAIVLGWRTLGVKVNLVPVSEIPGYLRTKGDDAEDLPIRDDPMEWLAEFLDVLGECREKLSADITDVLQDFLVNENRKLRSPGDLMLDAGVSEDLKDIAAGIGVDLRDRLVLPDILDIAEERALMHVRPLLDKVVARMQSEGDAVGDLLRRLNDELPQEKNCSDAPEPLLVACTKVIAYLWETQGNDAEDVAKSIPLISSSDLSVRWSAERMMMTPPGVWPEAAREFANIYPEDRVLSDLYLRCAEQGTNCIDPLVAWNIAYAEPLIEQHVNELKERRLTALAPGAAGAVVADIDMSGIALLHPEIFLRCQNDPEVSKGLLGMTLCYVVPNDANWRQELLYRGRRAGKEFDVALRPALWLADLKSRIWVAQKAGDEEKMEPHHATHITLGEILEPMWLNADTIEFLSICFKFDPLRLQLSSIDDQAAKERVLDSLAKMVARLGNDPETYDRIVQEADERDRKAQDIERAQRLGKSVEHAIRATLESFGLKLEFVDRGFDFRVTAMPDYAFEDLAIEYEVGEHLLEVKATTTGNARMTPLQAKTATEHGENYALCVVDLQDVAGEELDIDWTIERVEALTRIVPGIGGNVEATWLLVDEAASADPVRIRNESALRYEVPPEVWGSGLSIRAWAEGLRGPNGSSPSPSSS